MLAAFALSCGVGARGQGASLLPPVLGASQLYVAESRSGFALGGYDPVSYLTEAAPRQGSAAHEAVWGGLVWRFASAANRAAFLRDPQGFLPRLGGYDAAAVAAGRIVTPDPALYVTRSGRLYLFRNAAGRDAFLSEDDLAARAEAAWPALEMALVRG